MASLLLALLLATETTQATTVQVQPDTLDLSGRTVVLSVDDGYHNVYVNIYPLLRRYRMTMTLALIGGCITSGRPSYRPEERFLNRSEVQEMIDSCAIEIASHTLSHAWLTRVDSASAWSEVYGSKTLLESLFDTRVVTFVYPYGDMNARARRMVRRAGYRLARAVRPGVPNFWVDPYRIPEIELRAGADLATIKRRIRQRELTVLLLHRIVAHPTAFTEWSLSDFAQLLDWLHTHHVRVRTLTSVYEDWWREQLARAMVSQLAVSAKKDAARLFEYVDVDVTGTPHTR